MIITRTKQWIIILALIFSHLTLYSLSNGSITGLVVQEPSTTIYEQLFKEANLTFVLPANITEKDATTALLTVERIKQELTILKLPTQYINDHLIEARKAFEGQNVTKLVEQIYNIKNLTQRQTFVDALNTTFSSEEIKLILDKQPKIRYNYTKTLLYVKRIEQRRTLTFAVLDSITILDQKIEDIKRTDFNITEILNAHSLITTKFNKEQLDELPLLIDHTLNRAEQLQIEQTRLRTFIRASQQNIIGFVKRHPIGITLAIIILTITSFVVWNEIRIIALQRKISNTKIEQNVLKELEQKTQQAYFQEGSTSKTMYDIKMRNYHDKELTIKQQLPVFDKNLHEALRKRKYYAALRKLFTLLTKWSKTSN